MKNYTGSTSEAVSEREKRNRDKVRKLAAEGMVMLENDGVLPLPPKSKIALYGFGARHTVKGGTGSGAVNSRGDVSVYEGLVNKGFVITTEDWLNDLDVKYAETRKKWEEEILERTGTPIKYRKLYYEHASNPLIPPKAKPVEENVDTDGVVAVYVISRISGEFADRKLKKGDYYLSDEEANELRSITNIYSKTIVILNTGGIIDLSILDEIPISAVVLMSQAGTEGGNAVADILDGTVNPSGHLTDTWAYKYEDYPNSETFSHNNGNVYEEKYVEGIYVGYRYFDTFNIPVRYPFGYGLSYTSFEQKFIDLSIGNNLYAGKYGTGMVKALFEVKNTGNYAGKQTILLYASCPQTMYSKEKRRLAGFTKTHMLAPGESEQLVLEFPLSILESFHSGKGAYYLEAGTYYLFFGSDMEHLDIFGKLHLSETRWMEKVENVCPLLDDLKQISQREHQLDDFYNFCIKKDEGLPCIDIDHLIYPRATVQYDDEKLFSQYSDERINKIVEAMSLQEKATLVCGRIRGEVVDAVGSASSSVPGAAGETVTILKEKYGLNNLIMADGPAGIRLTQKYQLDQFGNPIVLNQIQKLMNRCFGKEFIEEGKKTFYQYCTALPIGTLLAQSFDRKVWEAAGEIVAEEMEEFHINLWLAPGMNIHRNPLCGRNYEYYSEDWLLSGEIAACITKSVQKNGKKGTTIKHFACNNQEENRMRSSSIVSERALREIYLPGFEYVIERAKPVAIMSSYNKINGVHAANNYDLCTKVARMEWAFDGIIMTDWTTTNGNGSSAAKCIWSGNDLIMPGTKGDIKEITDAVEQAGDQNLDIKYLNACVYRIIKILFAFL